MSEMDIGPYGPRGKDTPPLPRLMAVYGLIFVGVIAIPLLLFVVVRFFIL